jgi:hypothetical protein
MASRSSVRELKRDNPVLSAAAAAAAPKRQRLAHQEPAAAAASKRRGAEPLLRPSLSSSSKRLRLDLPFENNPAVDEHLPLRFPPAPAVQHRPGQAWCAIAAAMVKFYEAEARGARLRQGLRPIDEEISDPFRLSAATADVELDAINAQRTEGDYRYLNILRILDSFDGVERHENQKLWHWWMIVACLRHIYGSDWQNASTRVLRSLGLKEIRTEILVMTPRRFGKTWSVAMIVCALLLSVPGFRIAVISPGSRTSGKMLEEIKRMMGRLRGADRHICGMDKTKMFVSTDPLPAGSSIKSEVARRMCTLPTTSVIEVLPDNPDGAYQQQQQSSSSSSGDK